MGGPYDNSLPDKLRLWGNGFGFLNLSNRLQENHYNALGQLTKITYAMPSGKKTIANRFTYNKAGHLTSYSLPEAKLTYTQTYKANKTRVHRTNKYDIPLTKDYAYDKRHQLTRYQKTTTHKKITNTTTTTYAYDTSNNRIQTTQGPTLKKYILDKSSDRLTERWNGLKKTDKGWETYTYTPKGELKTKTIQNQTKVLYTWTYDWDTRGNLMHINLNNTQKQKNSYDISGLRYQKTTPQSKTTYVYDNTQKLLTQLKETPTGKTKSSYIYRKPSNRRSRNPPRRHYPNVVAS